MFIGKCYGSIAHLPGSRTGHTDKYITEGQARIATVKTRDYHDTVIVQEKLDGACVGVYMDDEYALYAITRGGRLCARSQYIHHHLFKDWIYERANRVREVLRPGERLVGEWLALAHGTRYDSSRVAAWEPFVAFDIMTGAIRLPLPEFQNRIGRLFNTPPVISYSLPCSIERARELQPTSSYGGEHVEGYVWRVERGEAENRKVDFLCKWVNNEFEPGALLPEFSGEFIWNWKP